MRIGILFNDIQESLARALRAVLPEADIVSIALDRAGEDHAARTEIFTTLRLCDHVITQDAGPEYGMFSNRALAAATLRLHRLPVPTFNGYHPDTVTITLDGVPAAGPAGRYHSRITVAAFLAGLPADETAALFTALVFARLGYFGALQAESDALQERYLAYGIDISAVLPRWREAGCFMHAPDRPKMRVMLDIARIACALMGVAPQTPSAVPPDPLAAGPQTPYFADLASRNGDKPEGAFRAGLPASPLSADEFVLASYDAFRRVPRACLRAVPGVALAAAKLDLPTARRPARALMPGAVGLLTCHGTTVRLERTSNLLVHEALWPDSDDSVDFTLTPEAQADGTVTAGVLPGLAILPGVTPGTMALRRNGLYLTADPGRMALPFKAEAVGAWESFVPLTAREAAALRAIASRPWSCNGGPPLHPATIRPGGNFTLLLGEHTADLRLQRPELQPPESQPPESQPPASARPDGQGPDADRIVLRGADGLLILQAAGPPPGDDAIPLVPVSVAALPPRAASVPAFRSTRPASWLLDEGEDLLHPPLTVSVEDAAWLAGQAPRPIGLRRHDATLRRMPASLLLAPGFAGMLFNGGGVLAHGADLPEPGADVALPPGVERAQNILTASPSLLAGGEVLEGPVFVTPGFGQGGDDAALLGTALPLMLAAEALPRGTRLLVRGAQPSSLPGALGLTGFPAVTPGTTLCQLQDAVWLEPAGIAAMPSALLRDLRARIAAANARAANAPARIFLQPQGAIAHNPRVAEFLASRGFVTIEPEALPPDALRDLFLHASLIVAPTGPALAYLIFCAPATSVLELSPDTAFRPQAWQIAEKLGLVHGVLPCSVKSGALRVALGRLRPLLRMMRIAADGQDLGHAS